LALQLAHLHQRQYVGQNVNGSMTDKQFTLSLLIGIALFIAGLAVLWLNLAQEIELNQHISIPQNAKVNFENNTVSIPKFKSIKAVLHRKFEGKIRQATVSKTATGKFYISFLVETSEIIPTKKTIDESKAVGIDVGIKDLVICSDGTKYENPKWYHKAEKRLNRMNRWRSRKVKGSANRQKWNRKVAKQHEKISNQRKDMWHKISHELLSKYDTICVEDLNVKGMIIYSK
jgi:putative transposase